MLRSDISLEEFQSQLKEVKKTIFPGIKEQVQNENTSCKSCHLLKQYGTRIDKLTNITTFTTTCDMMKAYVDKPYKNFTSHLKYLRNQIQEHRGYCIACLSNVMSTSALGKFRIL